MVAERIPERTSPPTRATRCRNGHPRTYKNLYRDSEGVARCLICVRATRQRWKDRHPTPPGQLGPRRLTRCKRGHPFTPENTYVYPVTGRRSCRPCRRRTRALWTKERRKAARMAQDTVSTYCVKDSPPQVPLDQFDAVARSIAEQARAIRSGGPATWRGVLESARGARLREADRRFAEKPPTPDQVIAAVAETFTLTPEELRWMTKRLEIAYPRRLAYYAIRQWARTRAGEQLGWESIARAIGCRDFTSALRGAEAVRRLVEAGDEQILRDLRAIRLTLAEAVTP